MSYAHAAQINFEDLTTYLTYKDMAQNKVRGGGEFELADGQPGLGGN
jgi:hypothetical protein